MFTNTFIIIIDLQMIKEEKPYPSTYLLIYLKWSRKINHTHLLIYLKYQVQLLTSSDECCFVWHRRRIQKNWLNSLNIFAFVVKLKQKQQVMKAFSTEDYWFLVIFISLLIYPCLGKQHIFFSLLSNSKFSYLILQFKENTASCERLRCYSRDIHTCLSFLISRTFLLGLCCKIIQGCLNLTYSAIASSRQSRIPTITTENLTTLSG